MVCSLGGRTSSSKMAGLLLLLTTLATLATFGSCYPPDSGNSSGNILVSHKSARQAVSCVAGKRDWTYDQFKDCAGNQIYIDGGNGTIDLSGWSDDQLVEIFDKKEKLLNGGFTIKNSQITGKNLMLTMSLFNQDKMDVVIDNNDKLVDFFLEIASGTKAPLVRISGNRLLSKDSLKNFDRLRKSGQIQSDSHIQIYGECNLKSAAVVDVAATLKNCKAIYGHLFFNHKSQFPANMDSIEKLAYVEGCIIIMGTKLKSWNDLTFLDGTKSKEGGCPAGSSEISDNLDMCIHPPEASKLKAIWPDMKIVNNQKCTAECTSRHVLEKADSTCEIITEPLVIDDKTTPAGMDALKNVKEIKGLLKVIKTPITNFNYLPKLTKLNSNNMSSGPVINLQRNSKMTHFDLPQLEASGVGTGRPGQIVFWTDKNGPDANFKGDDAFLKRIDPLNTRVAVPYVASTTEAQVTPADENLAGVIGYNIGLIVGAGLTPSLILVVPLIIAAILFSCGIVALPLKWKSRPMKNIVEQTDIYQYNQANEFIQKARDIVEKNKPKIEETNQRHWDNRKYDKLSVLNHNATRHMPGLFQLKDYEQNKEMRTLERYRALGALQDRDEINKLQPTLKLPAPQVNGLYGLAFEASFDAKYPPVVKYRTQCDPYSVAWFKYGLPPIYVEKFVSTAKRMCHVPCDAISENLRYLRSNSIKIPEFGISSKGFQTKTGVFGKVQGSRKAEEKEDLIWIKDQIPSYKFYRYREKMNELGAQPPKQYYFKNARNLHEYVIRMVEMMMSMPVGHVLVLRSRDVRHFLRVILPVIFGKAHRKEVGYPRSAMSAGGYLVDMNRRHVRIVGELRGDFDALRRAINIPSLLNGKDHPMLQYNWLFLGNYTGRHPQSVETIMFLLALQFLYGRDCIVLLRGVMEFANTSEEFGFKQNLKKRFGRTAGKNLWNDFMKVFARLPLNCRVLHAVYCSSGGFNDGDIDGKDKDGMGQFKEKTTLQSLNKIFSLPNYTVRDYFENVDTGAGYYYGERTLQKIAEDTQMYTFFSTGPMTGGVGYFCDTSPVQLFMLSSVKGLHGHGGMVTQLAAVAELNGQTGGVTFHMILEEDQMVYYDTERMELRNTPFDEEGGGKSKTTTTSTEVGTTRKSKTTSIETGISTGKSGTSTGKSTIPSGRKTTTSPI